MKGLRSPSKSNYTMQQHMIDYPLDVRGLILFHLAKTQDYRWVEPFGWNNEFNIKSITSSSEYSKKLYRLLEIDGSITGSTIPLAITIAIRQGLIRDSILLLRVYLEEVVGSPAIYALALSIIIDLRRQVIPLLNPSRELRQNLWILQDVPSWLIPYFVRRFRRYVGSQTITIISGGHILCPGEKIWIAEKQFTQG